MVESINNTVDEQEYLVSQAWRMKEGECMRISRHFFQKAFPDTMFHQAIDGRSAKDRFLEKLPGVNYGAYKLTEDMATGDLTLCRYECGAERVREDSDRRGNG